MEKYIFPTSPQAHPEAVVQGPTYRFTLLTDRLIRYEWAEDGQFEDRASTFAIHRNFPVPKFRVIDGDNLDIITEHFHLNYTKQKFSPESIIVHFSGSVVKYANAWRFGTRPDNLGGTARTLDGVNGRCDMGDGVLSRSGYAVVDDTRSMLFDGDGWVAERRPGARSDGYLFCYGHDYKTALKDFYRLSGKQPVLPRYALGNWWSRYYAYHQQEYVQLMDRFRAHDIPMSVAVVDMDWHLVSDKRVPHAGWTGYTWNRELFPDPVAFREELHKRRLKITLNDHPHSGVYSFEDAYEEMAQFMGRDTAEKDPILFDPTDPLFMQAYLGILHRRLEQTACDFWWIDWQQGPWSKIPGFDPLWLLNHFQYLDSKLHNKNPMIFSRYAGPGSHRYPAGFSGDTIISWASLAFQPEFTATASNIGYGWWSHDIGGHIHGGRDDELTARWVQLGVFSPVMRLHSTTSRWMSKEPWLYGPECESVMAQFMRFRHRLIPYLYTHNVLGSQDGEPLVQPIYWTYPDRDEAYRFRNEYFLGPQLLVAPIVQPRDPRTKLASVKAWLPPSGRYVDIFTGTVYDGNRQITFYRPLEQYPVLAPEGAIIPLDADRVPQNGSLNPTCLEILVVVGQDGQTSIIEDPDDDREQLNRGQEARDNTRNRQSTIKWDQQGGTLSARLNRQCHATGGNNIGWTFRFLAVAKLPEALRVVVNDLDVTTEATITIDGYPQVPSLSVMLPKTVARADEFASVVINLGPCPQLTVIDPRPRVEDLLLHFQADFEVKDRIWSQIAGGKKRPINAIVGSLQSLEYDEVIVGPILELVLADCRLLDLWEEGL